MGRIWLAVTRLVRVQECTSFLYTWLGQTGHALMISHRNRAEYCGKMSMPKNPVTPQNRNADVLGDEFIILRARRLKILYVGVQCR